MFKIISKVRFPNKFQGPHSLFTASKRTEILRWISPEPYIQHHEQTKKDVLAGTGKWILSDPVFEKWRTDSASSILWLHGMPGSGKSKLVYVDTTLNDIQCFYTNKRRSIIIEDAIQRFEVFHGPPPTFFYCSRSTAESTRSDPVAVLASIARQLSNLQPDLPLLKPTVELYKKKEAGAFASGPLRIEESCSLIIQLTEHYPMTIIVVDALDECDPSKRADLLEAFEEILQNSSNLVKIFISSRDDQDITFQLQTYPSMEISSGRNVDDITRFVKTETNRLVQKRKLLRYSQARKEMEELIVDTVINGAAGMYVVYYEAAV
jgi:hypothetical protein